MAADLSKFSDSFFDLIAFAPPGALLCNTSRVIVGGANGLLQLWLADLSSDQSSVTLDHSQELDGGVFTFSFDPKLELVRLALNVNFMFFACLFAFLHC